jgi:hypothetical protein
MDSDAGTMAMSGVEGRDNCQMCYSLVGITTQRKRPDAVLTDGVQRKRLYRGVAPYSGLSEVAPEIGDDCSEPLRWGGSVGELTYDGEKIGNHMRAH